MANKLEISIDVIIHATEDITKFFENFKELLELDEEKFEVTNLTGHFENPITMLSTKISKKEAEVFLKKFVNHMPHEQIEGIIDELDELVSDSTLHLRLDKQEFVQGRMTLGEKDPIKLKIFTPIYNKKELSKTYSQLLNP